MYRFFIQNANYEVLLACPAKSSLYVNSQPVEQNWPSDKKVLRKSNFDNFEISPQKGSMHNYKFFCKGFRSICRMVLEIPHTHIPRARKVKRLTQGDLE